MMVPTNKPLRPLTVAVTGGIGAGKSTVSRGLGGLGCVVIDSDLLAREVVAPGTAGLAAVVDAFGAAVLDDDGALDRPALGAIVFGDAEARRRLEGITHPRVRALFAQRVAEAGPDALVVNDIPLLRTIQDAARYHLVVTVGMTDEQLRVERLVARGHTETDARARIAAQIDDDARRALSDVWLDNSDSPAALRVRIESLHDRLVAFAGRRSDRSAVPPAHDSDDVPPGGPLLRRILDAVPGGTIDPAGHLVLPAGSTAEPDSLQDAGFALLDDGALGNCDPGRALRLPLVDGR